MHHALKSLSLLTIALLLSASAMAAKLPGTIIRNGVAEEVTLKVNTNLLGDLKLITMQYKITYYDKKGGKHKIRPGEADEVTFDFKGEKIRMISVENNLYSGSIFRGNGPEIFLHSIIEGNLHLYEFFYETHSMGPNNTMVSNIAVDWVLQKGNGPLYIPEHIGFRKSMLRFLDDCPAVSEKVEERELRRRDLELLVIYYNEACGN